MIVALLCGAVALASTWTASRPLGRATEGDGVVHLPAGVALRIDVRPGGSLPEVGQLPTGRDPETGELVVVAGPVRRPDLRGVATGLLVPLSDEDRLLTITRAGSRVRLRTTTRQGALASWLAVQRQVDRCGGLDDLEGAAACLADLELPWGSPATVASLRLRALAVDDRGVRALGTAHDLAHLLPLHDTTHARETIAETALDAGRSWELDLEGPATAVLALRPNTQGQWTRAEVQLAVDGEPVPVLPLAGRGVGYRVEELFLGPGEHHLSLTVPAAPVLARVSVAQLREPLVGPRLPEPGAEAEAPVDRAELAWLHGDRAAALDGFRALLDAPGPTGELARARVLALSDDPREIEALADLPAGFSPDGRALATDALLARAELLHPDKVEAAVLAAPRPDVAAVAAWLDSLGGTRSRGTALLRASRPLVDDGLEVASDEVRHRAVATRFTLVQPTVDPAEPARASTSDQGPGIPRVALDAGETAAITLPEWGDRSPVLRLRITAPARWTLDGQAWSAREGEIGVGMEPGTHHLAVEEGALLLLDPEVAAGGRPVFERALAPLPRTWELPDPGARADLRLLVDPPVPVRVRQDDGRLLDLEPDATGIVELTTGAWVERLEVRALDPGAEAFAALELRVLRPDRDPEPPLPVTDLESALAELRDLSRAIDLELEDARLARARLLGRMGLLSAARRDLRVLLVSEDAQLVAQARRLAGNLAPVTPSAPAPGPTSAAAALASHEDLRPLPEGPPLARAPALEALAEGLGGDPALWLAAAEAWTEGGELPRAWAAAVRAGAAGGDLRQLLAARTRWSRLSYPAGGQGIVRVPRPPEPPRSAPDDPLWRRARAAMLALPFEEEDIGVLRGDLGEVLRPPAGRLVIDLFCRDEVGPGRPCRVGQRDGQAWQSLLIEDGASHTLVLDSAAPDREVELSGPGQGMAVAVRVRLDGAPLPRSLEIQAHRAAPGRPLAYDLGGPVMVRVEALRGTARLWLDDRPAGEVGAGGEPVILPLTEAGPQRLEVRGDADVRAWAGTLAPLPVESGDAWAGLPEPLLTEPDTGLPVDVDAIFAHLGTPGLADLRAPGRGGSAEVGLSAHSELLTWPTERWTAAQLAARWLGSGPHHWAQAGAWGRAPGLGAGLLAEAGRTWPRAHAGLRLDGAASPVGTGQVGGTLKVRGTPSLGRTLDLRLEGWLRAAWLGEEPEQRVDRRVWSQWAADHPVHLRAEAALVGSPLRDLRWQAGVHATSNTGPSLDRFGALAGVDLFMPTGTVLGLDGRAELRLADAHRDESSLGAQLDLAVEHGWWEHERRWWRPWASAGWRFSQQGFVAAAGLRVLFGPRRGLADLPPGSVAFRALRDLP